MEQEKIVGLVVRLPLTEKEKTEVQKYKREHQKHMGRWVADLVLKEIKAQAVRALTEGKA